MRNILVLLFLLFPLIAFGQDIEELKRKANQGNADAQYSLGFVYDHGDGVPKDPKKAVYWYKKAAKQGNAMAQNNLAAIYYYGIGVAQDKRQAEYWLKKAQENK